MKDGRSVADTRSFRRAWIVFAIVALIASAVLFEAASVYGRASAVAALKAQGQADANLKVALLRAVLERPRAIPLLLSRDRDVEEAISDPGQDKKIALSRKLEDLVNGTNAAVIYVVGPDGIAVSASNWREATSFVGNDYTFRNYFTRGMREGRAEHFALGSVSKRPGLYISQRIGPADRPLGVVVVKMEFDQLEADWRDMQRPAFVTDDHDVVLITSIPSWRFMTTKPLPSADLAAIRESLQFGDAPLLPLPIHRSARADGDAELIRALLPGAAEADYLQITVPVASASWKLQYLLPVEKQVAAAVRELRVIAALGLLVALAIAAIWIRRRQAAQMAIIREQVARGELERRVVERTHDLSVARDRLQAEIVNHRATEGRLQGVQHELVQANRLAILGQVAAGVAHEINQPVATIRAYADNSRTFLERQQTQPVIDNLERIAGLTERIGTITEDLKALARRGRTAPEPVLLSDVMEGAVMLLRSRFTGRLEALAFGPMPAGLMVLGSRLRLEQVFINLFQNALEAVEGVERARVAVSLSVLGEEVAVEVEDNGPGIPSDILAALFEPFNSSKEKGLGLGLVISKDIAADYGGRIEVETGDDGTRFTVYLKKALQ